VKLKSESAQPMVSAIHSSHAKNVYFGRGYPMKVLCVSLYLRAYVLIGTGLLQLSQSFSNFSASMTAFVYFVLPDKMQRLKALLYPVPLLRFIIIQHQRVKRQIYHFRLLYPQPPSEITPSVSSRRHIKPCMQFSLTTLSNHLLLKAFAT
jgi:hypothetical protein